MMKKLVSALMIVCLLMTMLPLNAFAASKGYVQVTKDNAPLRTGKGEKYSIVVRATKGTVLEVVDASYNWYLNKWYQVKTANGTAYIYSGNVKKVSVPGYTTALTLSKSSAELNLEGTKTLKLNAICKYKNRTDTNVVWSTSNDGVAAVDSSGKVTAKSVGTCTITAKHKVFGTTATCKITVIEKVTLNTTAKEQSNSSCCSGASAFTVLKCLKGASFSKTDLQLYKEMGSTGVVYKIRDVLNKYLNKTVYKYGTYSSQSAYEKAVIKSIDAGYPVIALVKITDSKYFAYKSNGHFTTISGYRVNDDGSVDFRITDSYKISKNGGTFWIPAKVFFKYSKAHGNPYYLILKK